MKLLFLSLLLFSSCSNLFYQPSRRLFLTPEQFKLTYQDISFKSLDGTALNAWFFPSPVSRPKGTVIHFHGNAQNISTHFLHLLWMLNLGYNVFAFDYRGYGGSEGEPSQKGVHEDALAALEKGWELNQIHGQGHYIVYGQSLGSIISLRALADYKKLEDVTLIVQDSAFSSYKKIAFDRMTSRWFLTPLSPLAWLLVSDKYASERIFSQIHRPLLVIVGQKDEVIPQKFGKKIYKNVPSSRKWLWKLPRGKHIDVFHQGNERYRAEFIRLLDGLSRK